MEGPDLAETLGQLRDFADTLVQIRAKGHGSGSSHLAAPCAAAGTALLLRARELERQALLRAQQLREESAAQRSRLDHDALQLHNLVYEQQYYDKEISSCRAFTSAVGEDQVGSEAPRQQQHDQELARLTQELQQRKELKARLAALEVQRQREQDARAAAQGALDDLRSHLQALSQHSRPLLEATQPTTAAIRDDKEAAELLPLPLYILYTQAATAAAVVGLPVRVSVQGSVAAAQQEEQQEQQQQQQGQQGQAGVTAQEAKRRRKAVQEDDKTYKLHPLSVSLEVYHQAGDGRQSASQLLLDLRCSYYSQLKLVGVAAGSPQDEGLLTDLFLGDVGDGQLLENVAACSGSGGAGGGSGALQFGQAGRPRPFRWAQDLCGVDVLSTLPSSLSGVGADRSQVLSALSAYRSKLRLETFIERVAAAKQGRQQLKLILAELAKKEQPASRLGSKVVARVSTVIHSWKHLGEVGMQRQQQPLFGGAAAMPRPAGLQVWRRQQQQQQRQQEASAGGGELQGSIQEEGEVAGEAAGADVSSQLQHGDTAEEVLLLGLLDDAARPGHADGRGQQEEDGTAATAGASGAGQGQQAGGGAEVLLLDGAAGDAFEDAMAMEAAADGGAYPAASGGEPSADSGLSLADADADAAVDSAGGGGSRALLASHSLYRLVLKASSLEVHAHVMVFTGYPLCPPVFQVTKLLDTRRAAPVPITDINQVLEMHRQVNESAVKSAIATDAGEVLAVQVLHLRQLVDQMSAHMRGEHSKDLVDNLRAKQALQGRVRQPRLMGC